MPTSLTVSAFNPALCLCILALTIGVCRHAGNYLPAFLCVHVLEGTLVCLRARASVWGYSTVL